MEFGVVIVRGSIDPVSLQASGVRRSMFQEVVSAAIEQETSGLFMMDVRVELEWYVPVSTRYETHSIPDLDNVLKPLIDAISGPNRLMIDDNQVQSISAAWMDARVDDVSFFLRITNLDNQPLSRRTGLYFVEVSPGICLPLFDRYRGELNDDQVRFFQFADWSRREAIKAGISADRAASVMPEQRVFPRARLGKYKIEKTEFMTKDSYEDLLGDLGDLLGSNRSPFHTLDD
ncbi:RusA family crossover junction endodeoxyribonuclease [Rathayibacter festucae]|uniref:RusA family crossover junction endodeoxyribonuclease n=1 Tax=Rathayibacter festucae TaxID=110937 RepID=UPI002A6A91A2|nr:RusA family crossover junction endodeoxyribonuclease [Rathayibacter festucae]MDY0913663.1 RusA family crossover junction endodeoxyribonuclease [Rathayibacter festucae]